MYQLIIVDDEKSVVDSLAFTIPWEEYGIDTVHKAFSGKEALEILSRQTVHLMIVDIRMPGMTGLELIEKVHRQSKKIKCIVLTGYADFNYAQQAIQYEVVQYLLKPIDINHLIECVKTTIEMLQKEWEQISSYQQALSTLKHHLPVLRDQLLYNMIRGIKYTNDTLLNKLELLEIPIRPGDLAFLMLIRMEEDYSEYDLNSLLLFEYAIENIANESLGEYFELWKCKDDYDYIVLLIRPKPVEHDSSSKISMKHLLEQTAVQLQNNIHAYLKHKVSLLVSEQGSFPEHLSSMYQSSVSFLNHHLGNEKGLYMTADVILDQPPMQSLIELYQPPLLNHLLDAGHWEGAQLKIDRVFEELHTFWKSSQEHVTEVFFHIHSCFSYIVHRRGLTLNDVLGENYSKLNGKPFFLSVSQLQEWTNEVMSIIKENKEEKVKSFRNSIIEKVHEYIQTQINLQVSVQSIADHVHLHPVYLSKIYKEETGTTLGNALFKIRMERAIYMLIHTNDKIYEICNQLGYQNVPHFIKLFKEHFGMTPQEYRTKQ